MPASKKDERQLLRCTLHDKSLFAPVKRPQAHVVNESSMDGFLPIAGRSIYGTAKVAVKLLTEGLHSELAHTNMRVTVIFPGPIGTNIAANSGMGFTLKAAVGNNQRSIKPLEASKAAQIIIAGIEQNQYCILVGSDSKFMDFIYSTLNAPQTSSTSKCNRYCPNKRDHGKFTLPHH